MKNIFKRSKKNPILKPNPEQEWEALKVYNPGAVFHGGKYHLFYRAWGRGKFAYSSIGYAISENGEDFKRFSSPILTPNPNNPYEKLGLEDPRITKIENKFFMTYTMYDGKVPRLCIASSTDLKNWKKHGRVFEKGSFSFFEMGGVCVKWRKGKPIELSKIPQSERECLEEFSKSGAIFPEKINGKYWMLFNEFRIFLAYSKDGIKWHPYPSKKPFLEPRKNTNFFDNVFVEAGPPPIKTEKGWLVFYHGINTAIQYKLGFLLLDINDPTKILYRSEEPIFGPQEEYELSGIVDIIPGVMKLLKEGKTEELKLLLKKAKEKKFMPQVTFVSACVKKDEIIRIYYGAGDRFICTATTTLDKILNLIPL